MGFYNAAGASAYSCWVSASDGIQSEKTVRCVPSGAV